MRERRPFWRSRPSGALAASLGAAAAVGVFIGLHGVAELSPLPLAESALIFGYAALCSLGPNDLVKSFLCARALRRPHTEANPSDESEDAAPHAGASAMSKTKHHDDSPPSPSLYKRTLYDLRVQLVKLQNQVIRKDLRILVLFEGRDSAGKDGVIKRIVKNLSPRETRVVALGKPSDRDESAWYFQRYVPHLPVGGEIVLFNRSWYNRAGVESVMGFCTAAERESFMDDAPRFEQLLVRSGILLRKYYLDIGKAEQKRRLADRARNPLKQWKLSRSTTWP